MLFMIEKQVSQRFPCDLSVVVFACVLLLLTLFACVGGFENIGNFKFNRIYQVHLTHI